MFELHRRGHKAQRQVEMPITYDRVRIDVGFRIDLLVENCVIVELKAVDQLQPLHKAQLLSYLRLSKLKLGLLINFNSYLLKDGIVRIANDA